LISYEMADCAGLCVGVASALKKVDSLLDAEDSVHSEDNEVSGLYLWGPIINSNAVMDTYKARGVKVAERIGDLPLDYSGTVVFRAHGVTPDIRRQVIERGIKYVDATCPHVLANQQLAKRKADEGFQVVIIGDREHPEVVGVNGWAYGNAITATTYQELSDKLEGNSRSGPDGGLLRQRRREDRVRNVHKC